MTHGQTCVTHVKAALSRATTTRTTNRSRTHTHELAAAPDLCPSNLRTVTNGNSGWWQAAISATLSACTRPSTRVSDRMEFCTSSRQRSLALPWPRCVTCPPRCAACAARWPGRSSPPHRRCLMGKSALSRLSRPTNGNDLRPVAVSSVRVAAPRAPSIAPAAPSPARPLHRSPPQHAYGSALCDDALHARCLPMPAALCRPL